MKRSFSLSLVALLIIGTVAGAFADHRSNRNYSEREIRELGARRGYEIGYRAGMLDAREGYKFDYKRNPDYKFGMVGYRGEYKHDGNYKQGFRRGFENGYREAYERSSRRGGNWGRDNRDRNDRWNDNRRNDDRWNDDWRNDDRDYNRNRPYKD